MVGSSCLPSSCSVSGEQYSGYFHNLPVCRYGAVTLCRNTFQCTLRLPARLKRKSIPHMLDNFHCLIRFAVCGVQSLLLTASQLISFPAGTKTFQFPAFPNLSVSSGSPIRRSPVQLLHTHRRGISQLAASFIGASSQVFHLRVYLLIALQFFLGFYT